MDLQNHIPNNPRLKKLDKFFNDVLRERVALTPQNSALFIEAISTQADPATCVSKLIESKTGLNSVQASMRFDLSTTFINGPATTLLMYLQAPDLLVITGGHFLREVLLKIVEPPIFWNGFVNAFRSGTLRENGQLCFAWLLLQFITLPGVESTHYLEIAKDPTIIETFITSSLSATRNIGHKIKQILAALEAGVTVDGEERPGGRHDNDFADFREIAILPTSDEIISSQPPFLRRGATLDDPEYESSRLLNHLDNQFRLLREDMIYEMREELQVVQGKKKGGKKGFTVDGLTLLDIYYEDKAAKRCKWGFTLRCKQDLPQFRKIRPNQRRKFLVDNRKVLRHQSLACLIVDGEVVAFPTIHRDEDLLAQNPPVIVLQLEGEVSITNVLLKLKTAGRSKLIQIDSAIFSFEPILKGLQEIKEMPLSPELLCWREGSGTGIPSSLLANIVKTVKANPRVDLQNLLGISQSVILDDSQAASFISGLTQKVSLIQGPPGTGKSFIGALLAKALHDHTMHTILVVCYTNHALDQFLEDLLDIGIPSESVVRLGGKSTPRTEPLSLRNQTSTFKLGKADWMVIDSLKSRLLLLCNRLKQVFARYKLSTLSNEVLLDHLEFEDSAYYAAFQVPESSDGMTQVGKKGQAVSRSSLIDRWAKGQDAGYFKKSPNVVCASLIWRMPSVDRQTKIKQWRSDILREEVKDIYCIGKEYNECLYELNCKFSEKDTAILKERRIIGCTTTAAAMYRDSIQVASPGVLLVEEAGEILESHILTALGPETEQLILIGDHKQLRPKVNNYLLSVEKGEGYDLNRSLFERLVLKNYPHVTLTQQHRMRPEISSLVRHLTYPDLVDAPKTKNRPNLRGVQGNIVFIDHSHSEDVIPQLADRRDADSQSSKQNTHEAEMVLKIVRYLAQQGYGTQSIIILTPYLGQLYKLQEVLKRSNDPVLSDMDSYDLVRAGLLPEATANVNKKSIRLATIDNYQGEESDIVIVSLTRSNADHDIGFMASPERLNVLLSRARNALIILGNVETFLNARRGKELWGRLFEVLKRDRHIHDGLPVKCEQHPNRIATLSKPIDFDEKCPDGGCNEPCGTMLNCNLHVCPSKCHQLYDHSKMPCKSIISSQCPKGHLQSWLCHSNPPVTCVTCEREARAAEEAKRKAFKLQAKRDADKLVHDQQMAQLNQKITLEQQALRDAQIAVERALAVQQKEKDLEAISSLVLSSQSTPHLEVGNESSVFNSSSQPATIASAIPVISLPKASDTLRNQAVSVTDVPSVDVENVNTPPPMSLSQEEWARQKAVDGATNEAIDGIMKLIGLEEVKAQVLRIKDKIEVTKRQGSSLKGERFNVVLLGNPGTGKTTVARLYAKFLASVEVVPGVEFFETTGSRLAIDGVNGIKKHIERVIAAGGGAIFVDEAYQLTNDQNSQGHLILDFLLAEMENNVGTIVFILAGYSKQMERFFEHNPGLTSRVPYRLQFLDYTDKELLSMLEQVVVEKYHGKMGVEDGVRGLFGRILIRRLGRGRGRDGFGNARALHNVFAKVCERQASRLQKERKMHQITNDFLLSKADLIGPDPSSVILESSAWKKLSSLTGLETVKQSIRNLCDSINANYQRELRELEPIQISLNCVFFGNPGTGKTSVAKLYGQFLADLGLLSNGEVVIKNPADFIGSHLGESEKNTKAILLTTVGKVLIIDEAYMLYTGGDNGSHNDIYKTAVIDTIVAEIQSVPGEDRCVLLLGYKDQMIEMFQNVNPGLSRRFAIENAFHFEDFTDSELREILELKLHDQDLKASDAAKAVAIEVLGRSRNRPNFGNAGEVENLLGQAKARYQTRQGLLPIKERSYDVVFEPQDFDADFDRGVRASTNLKKLFEDVVGCEDIIGKLAEYLQIAHALKIRDVNPRGEIPMNFVFKGPPGTGKTTTARKIGQVYYDMGFLSSAEVVECSASDLVGQYVGHTGPKTKKIFEKALGQVLFIDEAYRLGEGHFSKEAIDELVGVLTQERFMHKVVVILAGYDQEMNSLMAVNTGLSSRFPDEIVFRNFNPTHCLKVLDRELKKRSVRLMELDDAASVAYQEMWRLIEELSHLASWGNARDMITLSKQMIHMVYKSLEDDDTDAGLTLSSKVAIACMATMLEDRRERCANLPQNNHLKQPGIMQQVFDLPPPLMPRTSLTNNTSISQLDVEKATPQQSSNERDADVTDEVWHQLQADKLAQETALQLSDTTIQTLEQNLKDCAEREEAHQNLARKLQQTRFKDATEANELKRKHEEMRLQEARDRAKRQRIADILEKERIDKRERHQQEAKAQTKLRQMGLCVAGFKWIKQSSGYRCAGGSHFVGNGALGIE